MFFNDFLIFCVSGTDPETKNVKYPPGMLPCMSSVPCSNSGVYCSRFIPVGTWIGPFEGEVIRPEELTADRDNGHMWEVGFSNCDYRPSKCFECCSDPEYAFVQMFLKQSNTAQMCVETIKNEAFLWKYS